MNLETLVVDSIVYEPSKEEMLVSEGPGWIITSILSLRCHFRDLLIT